MTETPVPSTPKRIASIDQIRGYAILGMIFVNCMGAFSRTPWWLHHNREVLSFNDTIAPLFIFVVGMSLRLSFKRHVETAGYGAAARKATRRYLILTAIGFVAYYGWWWDALTDIGVAGLIALPVMHRGNWIRALYALVALVVFQAIFSLTPYGDWSKLNYVNGGPLGPLAWCFILLNGTLAWELMSKNNARQIATGCLVAGAVLVGFGYGLSLPWGELKSPWPFSQYYMTAPYPLLSTGLCWWTLLLFHLVCDRARLAIPWLTLLGKNPLVLYLVHFVLIGVMDAYVPGDASWPIIIACFIGIYGVCHAVAWTLDRRGIIVKL